MQLHPNHQIIMDRFITACQADPRVAAALHVGSYLKGLDDAHSDLDLYLIIADDNYKDFLADRSVLIRRLGERLFMEDFDLPGRLLESAPVPLLL